MIGPFRGGRTVAASGVPGQPNVFYIGANNGGVWKTTDAGRVWKPIFDDQDTGSIGALAVAPSDPQRHLCRQRRRPAAARISRWAMASTNPPMRGQSWQHLGLDAACKSQQISAHHRRSARPQSRLRRRARPSLRPQHRARRLPLHRRRRDTGRRCSIRTRTPARWTWPSIPSNAQTVYAVLWAARQAPWEIGESFQGAGQRLVQIHRWRQHVAAAHRWIADGRAKAWAASASPSRPATAAHVCPGGCRRRRRRLPLRRCGRELAAHQPRGARLGTRLRFRLACASIRKTRTSSTSPTPRLTAPSTAAQRFTAIKGAPGGDDYHTIWINPDDPSIILLAIDQGATISVNGGETWSSWYNQPTAQFYHVITDNRFPYWVYGGQQESGSVGRRQPRRRRRNHVSRLASRGRGRVRLRGARSAESQHHLRRQGHALRPDHRRGAGGRSLAGPAAPASTASCAPCRCCFRRSIRIFSISARRCLLRTTNGGQTWEEISPDLTRASYEMPGKPRRVHLRRSGEG